MVSRVIIKRTAKTNYNILFSNENIWSNPWDFDNSKIKPETFKESLDNYKDWLLGTRFQDFMQRERALQLRNASLLSNTCIIACDYIQYAQALMDVVDSGIEIPKMKEEWILGTKKEKKVTMVMEPLF